MEPALVLMLAAVLGQDPAALVQWAPAPAEELPAYDEARAKALYREKCEACHGARGDGKGAASRYLDPPARDFVNDVFKFRSTPTGQPPTAADLLDSITRGAPGTSMPGWSALTAEDRWQLVLRVRSFAARKESPAQVLVIGDEPRLTESAVASARSAYVRLGCEKCHGDEGRGDGPSAGQVNDLGQPLTPASLRRPENYRGGRSRAEIFRTLATGMDGSAMPSYADSASPDELWELAALFESWWVRPPRK